MSACGGSTTVNTPPDSTAQEFQAWLAAVDTSTYAPVSSDGLPTIPVDVSPAGHSTSVVGDPVVKLGADHFNAYNYEDVETAVRLTAPESGAGENHPLAFAMYRIEGLSGLCPQSMTVACLPEMLDDNFYIGVADYTRMNWRFFGPFTLPETEVDLSGFSERFISNAGNFYFLVVTHAGMSCLHSQTSITFAEGGDSRLPGAPSGLQASDGEIDSAVGLAWIPGPGSAWFTVFRKLAGDYHADDPAFEWQVIGESLEPNYLDETAEAGVVYAYKVRAGNEAGQSGFSNVDTGFAGGEPPVGYRIHGWLRTPPGGGVTGEPVPNVEVTLLGLPEPLTIRTAEDGAYSFDNLPQGIYLVVPHDQTMGISPVYTKGQIGPDHPVVEANFTVNTQELPSWRIWGFIWTFDGDTTVPGSFRPLAAVPVSIAPHNPAGEAFTVATNEDGFYAAYEQPAGVYIVTPGADGYTFQPTMHDVNVDHEHVTPMLNFVGIPHGGGDACSIEGSISGHDGGALAEINVALIPFADPAGTGVFTDVDGHFSFEGLAPGKYIVVPNNPHRMFDPKYQVVVLEAGQTVRCDFVGGVTDAYYRVWGFTFRMQGEAANHFAPLPGALVKARLDGSETYSAAESNADGYWEITELPVGVYIVSAAKTGFQFEPGSFVQTINGEALAPPVFFQGFSVP